MKTRRASIGPSQGPIGVDSSSLVLLSTGRQTTIAQIGVGDRLVGTELRQRYRRFTETEVLEVSSTTAAGLRVTLHDGTEIIGSDDHLLLTNRGWKFIGRTTCGRRPRPSLTPNNTLMGFGLGMPPASYSAPALTEEYRRGYLTGMVRGDGMRLDKTYYRRGTGKPYRITMFRLALIDPEGLLRTKEFLEQAGVRTALKPYTAGTPSRRPLNMIITSRRDDCAAINEIVTWPAQLTADWCKGYLAGIFDAEGSYSCGVMRISNADEEILTRIASALGILEFDSVREPPRPNGVATIRITGGHHAQRRFLHTVSPAITRKHTALGKAVKTYSNLRVRDVERLCVPREMVNIFTSTGDVILNGVIAAAASVVGGDP